MISRRAFLIGEKVGVKFALGPKNEGKPSEKTKAFFTMGALHAVDHRRRSEVMLSCLKWVCSPFHYSALGEASSAVFSQNTSKNKGNRDFP